MKTPSFALLLLFTALAPRNVFALIGQTRAKIEYTMGAPVDVVGNQAVYQHNGYTVVICYWNGASVFENISRAYVKSGPTAAGAPLSDKEVQDFLGFYGAGKKWKRGAGGGWESPNGRAIATRQEEQAPVRSHMTPQEENAIRKTPSLLIADVSFALALRREQASKSTTRAVTPVEAQKLTGAFDLVIGHALHISNPPYPYGAVAYYREGRGIISVTFDGSGCVASTKMKQTLGNEILDRNTEYYAKAYWSGPPNTTISLPIIYLLY